MASLNVLVVDDELNIRKTLAIALEAEGHHVVAVSNRRDALDALSRSAIDLAFVDLRLGLDSGSDLIPELAARAPGIQVVVITAHGTVDAAVETMKRGAADFLTKPFTPAQIRLVAERVVRTSVLVRRVEELQSALTSDASPALLDSRHAPTRHAIDLARQVAGSDATVLLRGESGTGKGVFARAIHAWSARRDKPFSVVSAPSLSAQLLESELFGHVRGSFTGAVRDNPGRIAISEGGSVFLDEIGDLPLDLQPKLLRFIQDREYERVGETKTRRADVRLLTATNVNLEAAVCDGTFREDLLYRINVFPIDLPPLRERLDDVPQLVQRMLADLAGDRRAAKVSDAALALLQRYAWPGNVRELRNVLERALILAPDGTIAPDHLPANLNAPRPSPPEAAETGDLVSLAAVEESHIRRVLAATKSLDEAAEILGIDLATLWRRRKKYQI